MFHIIGFYSFVFVFLIVLTPTSTTELTAAQEPEQDLVPANTPGGWQQKGLSCRAVSRRPTGILHVEAHSPGCKVQDRNPR